MTNSNADGGSGCQAFNEISGNMLDASGAERAYIVV